MNPFSLGNYASFPDLIVLNSLFVILSIVGLMHRLQIL